MINRSVLLLGAVFNSLSQQELCGYSPRSSGAQPMKTGRGILGVERDARLLFS